MKPDYIATLVAIVLSVFTVTSGLSYYHIHEVDSMKSNIESAIVKGIDPIAVKCAYGKSDPVCIVYASGKKIP